MTVPSETTSTELRGGVGSPSFIGLLLTQLLGTFNDNMFRWFAVCLAKPMMTSGNDDSLAVTLGLAAFTVPYLILAVPAGFLADRFSKRSVIVACKVAEIIIMALGIAAILSGNAWLLMGVVALTGAQAALFGPSKYGAIPELITPEKLSSANGFMGLATVGASALGTIAGYWLDGVAAIRMKDGVTVGGLMFPAALVVGTAVVGTLTSLLIRKLPAANPNRKLESNPAAAVVRDMKLLWSDVPIRRTALGIAFFWMLASLANLNLDSFGEVVVGLTRQDIGTLGALLVVGVGVGSVVAGTVSRGKVELGIVTVGALGITLSCCMLFVSAQKLNPEPRLPLQAAVKAYQDTKSQLLKDPTALEKRDEQGNVAPGKIGEETLADLKQKANASYPPFESAFYWVCFWLFMLGASAGFFDIPLEANLQHRADVEKRGTILAATNFMTFTFILGSAAVFHVLRSVLGLAPDKIFLIAGIATAPVIWQSFRILPQSTIRFIVWVMSLFFYRIRVIGREHIPERGGALIVANHVSWLDGVLLIMVSNRPIRMLAYSDYVDVKGPIGWLSRTFGTIPIKNTDGPKALLQSLNTAKDAIKNGELVCIFAEGALTRTGQLQQFNRGLMRIVAGTGAPVVPCYLDQLWGSVFSYHGGKFFWKWPKHWPFPIGILFGQPIADPDSVVEVRQAVEQLGVQAVSHRPNDMIPVRQFLRACRDGRKRAKVADSAGLELTGGKLLAGSLAFARVLARENLRMNERNIGILLPPSVGGVLANTAVSLLGKTSVNLNYTLSDDVVNFCIREAGITHVITSKKFLEKKPMKIDAEWIFLEDVKEGVTPMDKLLAGFSAFVEPISILERRLGLHRINPNDPMTIIFTSGSTGEPKGVMLSHRNVGSNIHSADQLFQIADNDVLMGVLPFFHSFGYSLMMWLPLTLPPKGVYHFNPLDARTVGSLCEQHKVTIIAATPTFLKGYLKRCTKEQMATMDLAIVGAEKLPLSLAEDFHKAFGIYPTEGFGTTELSPLAAANVPDHRNNAAGTGQTGTKLGTVGRPVPNVAAKVVDPDTGADLGTNKPGLLKFKGPNVMLGYLNRPEKTAESIQEGWYNTGDIAVIDDDGFITITGRLSRFSKIGGEMVPHIRIEEELIRSIGDGGNSDDTEVRVAVSAVPDESKGERIIVLHKAMTKPIDAIQKDLSAAGLPNLWIPGADSFFEVEQIPLLGTGKLDLRGIKQKAHELTGIAMK